MGGFEAGTPVSVEPTLKYHILKTLNQLKFELENGIIQRKFEDEEKPEEILYKPNKTEYVEMKDFRSLKKMCFALKEENKQSKILMQSLLLEMAGMNVRIDNLVKQNSSLVEELNKLKNLKVQNEIVPQIEPRRVLTMPEMLKDMKVTVDYQPGRMIIPMPHKKTPEEIRKELKNHCSVRDIETFKKLAEEECDNWEEVFLTAMFMQNVDAMKISLKKYRGDLGRLKRAITAAITSNIQPVVLEFLIPSALIETDQIKVILSRFPIKASIQKKMLEVYSTTYQLVYSKDVKEAQEMLRQAVTKKDLEAVKKAIELGAWDLIPMIKMACSSGSIDVLEILLTKENFDPNDLASLSIKCGNKKVLLFAFERGANNFEELKEAAKVKGDKDFDFIIESGISNYARTKGIFKN